MIGRARIPTDRYAHSWRRLVVGASRLAVLGPGLLAACAGGAIDLDELSVATTSTVAPSTPTSMATSTSIRREGSVSGPVDPYEVVAVPSFAPSPVIPDPVDLAMGRLTLEQKVGQLIVAAVWGTDAVAVRPVDVALNQGVGRADTPAEVVALQGIGGVLYLQRNVDDGAQVAALSAGLQAAAAPSGIGLLIAVDQEGGRVNRVSDGATRFQSARELAGDSVAVRSSAAVTAMEMLAMGVNVVLAPVADVTDSHDGIIGDRSYGGDPNLVAEMVAASIDGLQAGDGGGPGAAAAVKHWPGHGATDVDSHRGLPVIPVDEPTWRARERVPFAAAVAAGVDVVLVGHLAFPGIDPTGEPATVSAILIDGYLRGDLGFQGVVMTDALDMGAVAGYERGELVVWSIAAGADILLAPPDVQLAREALVNAVTTGRLTMERIDASVERILRLKLELGIPVS
ncbi:MAG: beta-hexosaminidase [Actinomycetota bacterium]|nr:beta-hexosaminidase [Actinomycetota bacterium]